MVLVEWSIYVIIEKYYNNENIKPYIEPYRQIPHPLKNVISDGCLTKIPYDASNPEKILKMTKTELEKFLNKYKCPSNSIRATLAKYFQNISYLFFKDNSYNIMHDMLQYDFLTYELQKLIF